MRHQSEKEHIENNPGVRKIMIERGLKPENLPVAEDIKKVERRLKNEEKKISAKKSNKRGIVQGYN